MAGVRCLYDKLIAVLGSHLETNERVGEKSVWQTRGDSKQTNISQRQGTLTQAHNVHVHITCIIYYVCIHVLYIMCLCVCTCTCTIIHYCICIPRHTATPPPHWVSTWSGNMRYFMGRSYNSTTTPLRQVQLVWYHAK